MNKFLSVSEIITKYGKSFYKKVSKAVPPTIHSTLGIKMFERSSVEAYENTYLDEERVSIKSFCKMIGISREWYYQLVKKEAIPEPRKEKTRYWGYTGREAMELSKTIKEKNLVKESQIITMEMLKKAS